MTMRPKRSETLYNLILPVWMIFFWPSYLWLILIPLNYLWDRIVLYWSLKDLPERGRFCRRHTWKICLAGFLSDLLGFLLLLGFFILSEATKFGDLVESMAYYDPFSHPLAFLTVALSVLAAGFAVYFLDRLILTKAGLAPEQAKRSALWLALLTAPYLYFFPTTVLYESGIFGL